MGSAQRSWKDVNSSDGMKGVAYQNLGVVLIKAVQERQQIIEELTQRVEQLENKN